MVPLPGVLDPKLKEFWVGNPWQIVAEGYNLSAFERNRAFLNVNGNEFLEISHLTGGADSDGDGRGVVAADFRNSGQLDLIVRQAGGGPLFCFENQFPKKNWLSVSLKGIQSNAPGIGARLVAEVNGKQIVREMYPYNGYFSQAPNRVHFGLGAATKIDRLSIRWPSGQEQVLKDLAGNRHLTVTEGSSEVTDKAK